MTQRTSKAAVSDGLARQIGRMAEDATHSYPGGLAKAELARGHPDFVPKFYGILDQLAAEQATRLPLLGRLPFATIEVGTYKTAEDLRRALVDGGFCIGDWASNLMSRPEFTFQTEPSKLDLSMASNAELGYPDGCTVAQSFEALKKIGAVKLPPEAGAQYRLQCKDQPLNEWRSMYMDSITDSDGGLRVFRVGHHVDWLWLFGSYAGPDGFCYGDEVWVFTRGSAPVAAQR